MRFVNLVNQIIYTVDEIIFKENASIPYGVTDLSHLGYAKLNETVPIYDNQTQNCEEDGFYEVSGEYFTKWNITQKTQEELDILQKRRVPAQIAMWQARDVMIKYDILDDVINFIDNIQDPIERKRAQSKFEFSNTVRRDDPLLNFVASQANFTQEQIDMWFIEANET